MSLFAFSISSNKITEYGLFLTCSVNCPPSSCPTYPGGEPISLEMVCFSWYSDISTLIKESSLPKISFANFLAKNVLPTPVDPRNMNDPIGLFGSLIPTLFLLIDLEIFLTASLCPITFLLSESSRFISEFFSSTLILLTGIFVIFETTS